MIAWIGLCVWLLAGCQHGPFASQHNPQAAAYNVQLGLAYLQAGDNNRAKFKLQRALSQSPMDPVAWGAMGHFLEATGEMEKAEAHHRQAVALSPRGKQGLAYNNYGIFLCKQKRYQASEAAFLRAIHERGYHQTAEAYENAGLCMAAAQQHDKAEQYFAKAVQHDPKRGVSWLEQARLAAQRGAWATAEHSWRMQQPLVPQTRAHWQLGLRIASHRDNAWSQAMLASVAQSSQVTHE